MSAGKVGYERRGRIALVTLDRPEVKNAIDPEMDAGLAAAWRRFRDDEGVDVAILTGPATPSAPAPIATPGSGSGSTPIRPRSGAMPKGSASAGSPAASPGSTSR